ncbi:hypothetical protein CWO27_22470 [Vibrio sp. 10N.286.51.C3]|uniref:hypothetical protein n=1 Tax=unclassified Vibrio TaxID=2614977 RepID=UPI000D38C58B|nr:MULTISPECIES: hypothetical protein [unclassified Vibrio]PTP11660.1 hypothetical protein CWO27_22470 [Vibrio sp. 10N.286.51.C3]TKE64598.1 hypothetical protein FCV45_13580 [Vibrio sp. F12]
MVDTLVNVGKSSPKAEDIGEKTVTVIKEINRFNNAMNIGKSGGDLNKVINVLTGSSLSKFSASLGALGATISLISLFTSGKSSDQIIIDMLGDLDKKIDSLQSIMLSEFDHLESVVQGAAAKMNLTEAISVIDTAIKYMNIFMEAPNDGQRKAALKDLKELKIWDIRNAVSKINLTVTENVVSNNIYDAEFEANYADAVHMQDIGLTLNYYVTTAKVIDDFLHCIDLFPQELLLSIDVPDGGNPLDYVPGEYLDQVENVINNNISYYQDPISNNESKWLSSLNNCKSDCEYYIDKYFTVKIAPNLDAKNHKSAVNSIIESLDAKWGWLDFFAVVYDDVTGFSKHAMSGLSNRNTGFKTYFRNPSKNGKINAVIAWVDNSIAAVGATKNTNVDYTYQVPRHAGMHTSWISKTYKGKAEEFRSWGDLRSVLHSLTDNPPSSKRLVWVAKKKEGVSRAQSNGKRLLWVNGKYLDIAIFE